MRVTSVISADEKITAQGFMSSVICAQPFEIPPFGATLLKQQCHYHLSSIAPVPSFHNTHSNGAIFRLNLSIVSARPSVMSR